jgi:hypothetical protein
MGMGRPEGWGMSLQHAALSSTAVFFTRLAPFGRARIFRCALVFGASQLDAKANAKKDSVKVKSRSRASASRRLSLMAIPLR